MFSLFLIIVLHIHLHISCHAVIHENLIDIFTSWIVAVYFTFTHTVFHYLCQSTLQKYTRFKCRPIWTWYSVKYEWIFQHDVYEKILWGAMSDHTCTCRLLNSHLNSIINLYKTTWGNEGENCLYPQIRYLEIDELPTYFAFSLTRYNFREYFQITKKD